MTPIPKIRQSVREKWQAQPNSPELINACVIIGDNQTITDITMESQITVPNVDDFDVVEISEILVALGDTVNADDSVVTLESEKAAMEIPSTKSGVIKDIHVKVGDAVKTDTLLVTLETESDTNQAETAEPESVTTSEDTTAIQTATRPQEALQTQAIDKEEVVTQQQTPHAIESKDTTALRASPSVRRFARELGVKLSAVAGTGPKGRITRADVAQYFSTAVTSVAQSKPAAKRVDYKRFGNTRTESIGGVQRIIAEHLQSTWQTIPHVWQHGEADISELENYRKQHFNGAKKSSKTTLLPFLIKALAHSLREFPRFNASLENSKTLLLREYYHIGFAIDTEHGLFVPVIRDVDQKDIKTINSELKQLARQAKAGKLSADDMSGGCITISNLGGLDSGAFTPIINAPEAAILGISRTRITPVWDGEQFVPRPMLPLHLCYDHRLNNGVAAVNFLNHYKALLSKPDIFN